MTTPTEPGQANLGPEGERPARSERERENGHWPPWWQKFRNDFKSAKRAESNDGLVHPTFEVPAWTNEPGAGTAVILDAARRRHEQAEARIVGAEGRAHRLLQTSLTALTLALVNVGWQATRLRHDGAHWWEWAVVLLISGAAIVCIAMSAAEALGVDRVGYVYPAEVESAARFATEEDQRRDLARQEARGALMANWTGRKKVNEFLQARAWFTRGVSLLIASGICTAVIWTATGAGGQPSPPRHHHEGHHPPAERNERHQREG